MRLAIWVVLFCCLATNANALDNQPDIEVDTSGKGAILCLHSLVAATLSFARKCKPDGAIEIQRLEKAIERLENFEIKNGNWTESQAAEFTDGSIREAFPKGSGNEICAPEGNSNLQVFENFYAGFASSGSKKYFDNALSVPRKPVMNPCL